VSRLVLAIGFLVPLVSAAYVLRLLLVPGLTVQLGGGSAATSPPPIAANQPPATPPPTQSPIRAPTLGPPPTLGRAEAPPASPEPAQAREIVVVANTGAIGGVLRAEPVSGAQVAALREGQRLEVLDRTTRAGGEWVHVRTAEGVEGWIAARIVAPAPP
jgi:hypothetical protein